MDRRQPRRLDVGGALVRMGRDGRVQVIASDPGWLDYPSQPAFGTRVRRSHDPLRRERLAQHRQLQRHRPGRGRARPAASVALVSLHQGGLPMKRQLVALGAALLLIAALVPPVAAPHRAVDALHVAQRRHADVRLAGWLLRRRQGRDDRRDRGVRRPAGRQHRSVLAGQAVEEHLLRPHRQDDHGPRRRRRLDHRHVQPRWGDYAGPALFGTPQFSTVREAGIVWSLVASDGARLNDTGVATTKWEFSQPGEYGQIGACRRRPSR